MTYDSKTLLHYWSQKPLSRRTLLVTVVVSTFANSAIGKAIGATAPIANFILGRPTSNSIALNILATEKVRAYVEYGYTKSKYTEKTSIDALVTLMTGAESIRDVIAFPKTQCAQCLLTQAPSPVDEKQLRELHIRLRNPQPVA